MRLVETISYTVDSVVAGHGELGVLLRTNNGETRRMYVGQSPHHFETDPENYYIPELSLPLKVGQILTIVHEQLPGMLNSMKRLIRREQFDSIRLYLGTVGPM